LVLALFAFQTLPINYAGLALMLLGALLMVAEAFVPSFGALGIGGVLAFVIGSVLLIDTDSPAYGISPALIISVATISSLLFLVIIVAAVKARHRHFETGNEGMVGMRAEVLEDFEGKGRVRVEGENWLARSSQPLKKGQEVMVEAVDGLTLQVSPLDKPAKE
jgi:membrane-bound serine protease (ClpP class)